MSKGSFGLQTRLEQYGSKCAICGPKTWLFFSLGKRMCKRRLWKWASFSIGSFIAGTWRGGRAPLPGTLRDR
jgi:hypothetical protein